MREKAWRSCKTWVFWRSRAVALLAKGDICMTIPARKATSAIVAIGTTATDGFLQWIWPRLCPRVWDGLSRLHRCLWLCELMLLPLGLWMLWLCPKLLVEWQPNRYIVCSSIFGLMKLKEVPKSTTVHVCVVMLKWMRTKSGLHGYPRKRQNIEIKWQHCS